MIYQFGSHKEILKNDPKNPKQNMQNNLRVKFQEEMFVN